MADQGDHIVLKCSGQDCGMRYPSPADDPRRDACPLCESPASIVGTFAAPPAPAPVSGTDNSTLVGVLDNIRSALNVGTMMRSADGAGFDHLYLGGLTAKADNPKVVKTALGAHESVPSTSCLDILPSLDRLSDAGYEIWAVDFTERSEALQTIGNRPAKLAIVVGNETAGVDPEILRQADRHVHLDMRGSKTTLNVGVTFGILAYRLRNLPVRPASVQA